MAYAAARYGAYRSLLSWEIMRNLDDAWPLALKKNPEDKTLPAMDIDLARRGRRDVEDWVAQMAQQLRGFDQHNHPICVSTTIDPGKMWTSLQGVENLDWTLTRDCAPDAKSVRESSPASNPKSHSGRKPRAAPNALSVPGRSPDSVRNSTPAARSTRRS